MTIVDEQIETLLNELTAQVPAPVTPFGYGVDLSCTDELDPELAEVDPTSIEALSQALYRRYITPRGALADDGDYGYDLRGLLNRGLTDTDLIAIASGIANEARKDDRVDNATATVAFTGKRAAEAKLSVTPLAPEAQPFTMTLALTDADVLLQEIN